MHHVKYFLHCYDRDATKVPLNFDLLRGVKQPRAKHAQRMSAEESTSQRKATEEEQPTLEAEERA